MHHLINLAKKWGIEDDGYRDELVFNSSNSDLTELVNSIGDDKANALNDWFCEPELTDEYIKFSVFFMAFEYAKSILESRSLEK
ncbi:hypothetical protein ACFQ21_08935 [Ohtaekwangia kribbensis]|uniref:Uncharacterized protein n=1 Tax=Ohtaekwangia kribbensis TaxID=688913 RepID=A0ABW3JZL9_9BACT